MIAGPAASDRSLIMHLCILHLLLPPQLSCYFFLLLILHSVNQTNNGL